jgi:3-oxoacyl-[acyl-carrier protein] reductase
MSASSDTPVAFISGSRTGLGRFIAERLLEKGYQVVGCSRKEAGWTHKNYTHVLADVSNETEVKALFSAIRKEHGTLSVAINNAGIASMNHSLLTSAEAVERIVGTNIVGSFLIARESAKLMRQGKFGRIINFSTVAVPMSLEGEAAYVSSKAGVEAMTRVLAREFAEFGITVNAVGPSPIKTDLIAGVPNEKIDAIVQRLAIKRLGTADDVYNVVDFFLRPESNYITGQVIYLGGA